MIDISDNRDSISYSYDEADQLDNRFSCPNFGAVYLTIYQVLAAAGKSKEYILQFIELVFKSTGTTRQNKSQPMRLISAFKQSLREAHFTEEEVVFFFTFLHQFLARMEELDSFPIYNTDPQIMLCCTLFKQEAEQIAAQARENETQSLLQLPVKPLENKEDKKARSLPTTDQAIYFLFHLFQHRGIVLDKDEQAAIIAFLQGKSLESTRQRLSTLFTDKNKSRKLVENDLQVVREMFQQMNAPDLVDLITREKK